MSDIFTTIIISMILGLISFTITLSILNKVYPNGYEERRMICSDGFTTEWIKGIPSGKDNMFIYKKDGVIKFVPKPIDSVCVKDCRLINSDNKISECKGF